jgi:hypothetical protein
MLQSYQNAYVAIGALDAESSSSDFLHFRHPRIVKLPAHDNLLLESRREMILVPILRNCITS